MATQVFNVRPLNQCLMAKKLSNTGKNLAAFLWTSGNIELDMVRS